MAKFSNAVKAAIKLNFEAGDQPTEAQFASWIDDIQDGIDEHDHIGVAAGDGMQALGSTAGPLTLTMANAGCHILDTGGDHDLIITPGEDLAADRILSLIVNDAARSLTIEANSLLNQDLTTDASPTFADVLLPDGGEVGIVAAERFVFDAAGYVRLTGADLIISGAAVPPYKFVIDCEGATNGFQIVGDDTGRLATDGFTFALVSTTVYLNNRENASIFIYTNGTEAVEIDSAHDVHIVNLSGANQAVGADATGKLYVPHVSDRKLKSDIKPLTGGLDVILALQPVTFDWNEKALEKVGLDFTGCGRQAGLVAQEVTKVIPLAKTDGKKYKSYDRNMIVPYLIEAVKELNAKVKVLEG